MPVEITPSLIIDSRQVRLGDWFFYQSKEDLEQIQTQSQLDRVRYALDDHNLRMDQFGIIPKVFRTRKAALDYADVHHYGIAVNY